jgi:hypothetical protein
VNARRPAEGSLREDRPVSSGEGRGHRAEDVIHDRVVKPTTADGACSREDEIVGVLRWRMTQLVQAGFPAPRATELAVRLDVNLHDALALTANGCPPETAARILL